MQSEQELVEYCNSALDIKSQVHKQFLIDLKKIIQFVGIITFFSVNYLLINSYLNASFGQPKTNI